MKLDVIQSDNSVVRTFGGSKGQKIQLNTEGVVNQ